VLGFIRERGPVSGRDVLLRFAGDEPEVLTGVLSDLSQSGLVYRAGRGDGARYRIAEDADFAGDDATVAPAREHLAWLAVYRSGPATEEDVRALRASELRPARRPSTRSRAPDASSKRARRRDRRTPRIASRCRSAR